MNINIMRQSVICVKRALLAVFLVLSIMSYAEVENDSTFEKGMLSNGLTYYVKQNALPENTIEFRLVFKAGSILETDPQSGLAHFCEHMAFNGTEHFEGNQVIKYLESVGVEFGANLNASTGFDRTIYQFSLPYKDEAGLDSAYMIFSDWVKGLRFNDEDIDAERGVIMSEWRTSQGQKNRFEKVVIPKLYYNSRYAERLPIGDTAVIQYFEYQEIKDFYKSWYRPDLTAIIVSGDIDKAIAVAKVKQWFAGIPMPETYSDRPYYHIPKQDTTFVLKIADPEETTTSLSLTFKEENSLTYEDADVKEMLEIYLFSSIFNSRLLELSKSSNAPFISASVSEPSMLTHTTTIKSISITPKEQGYIKAIEAFRIELDRISQFGVLDAELDRQKEAVLKIQKRNVTSYSKRKSSTYANSYIKNFLFGSPLDNAQEVLESYLRILPTITKEDLLSVISTWYTTDNRVLLIETPEKYESDIPTDDVLLGAFDNPLAVGLEPYVEQDYSKPFFTDKLLPTTIVDSSYVENLDITEWTLSNGVKVILKPTDYANDYIQFRAFSPGGHSLLSDDDFFAASKMHTYMMGTGYGDFTKAMLRKKFNDKTAKVVAAVNQYDEGVVGSSDHDGFELMLQYVYMQFVHPREDSLVFDRFKNRLYTSYKEAHLKPSYVFSDTLTTILYQDHSRKFVIPEMKWVDDMTVQQMSRIHADRFADASDFTFVFVGDYDIDSLRPLLVSYLGNLPSINRVEELKDIEAEPLKSSTKYEFPIGKTENVSKVSMRFNTKSHGGSFEQEKVSCASSILGMRLLEVLREKEGDVYSVSAKGAVVTLPSPLFQGSIFFTCEPDKVDKLIKLSEDIIKKLAKEGPTQKELDNVKNIEIEKLRKYQESNLFWVRSLKVYIENGWNVEDIMTGVENINAIDGKDVQRIIKQYYKKANTFVLAPEIVN